MEMNYPALKGKVSGTKTKNVNRSTKPTKKRFSN